ncbi:MAG: outer membrane beta-barrel protein [Bacteroidota bacterium]
MDDNKDIEKVSRTVFDNLKMTAPDNAWEKLDADLNKKQAVVYKQRANRFKLLSIALLFIIFSFVTWQYLVPSSTSTKLAKVSPEVNAISNESFSNTIETGNISTSNLPDADLKVSKNKKESIANREKYRNQKLNKSQNPQSAIEVKPIEKRGIKKMIRSEKQDFADASLNLPTGRNEISTKPNSTNKNSSLSEFENVTFDSTKTIVTQQNILTTNIPDSGLPTIEDSNKSEPPYFVSKDSLLKNDLVSKSRLSLAVFYSPNQSWCNLKDNTNDHFDDVAMYNNMESSKFSFTTGLNLKYDLSNKWSLLTGAAYSTIAKSITIQTMYAEANADNEMHFQYPTSNGIIEMPFDDTHPNLHPGDSVNVKAVCNQSLKFINVPLMLRFQLSKKKITGYLNAGLSANFIIQEKAKINMNNSETTIINHVNGLKKMNYGFLFGAGVQYNIYDDLGVFIEPMLRGSFTSITQNTNVNSYPYSIGLNLGISLHF